MLPGHSPWVNDGLPTVFAGVRHRFAVRGIDANLDTAHYGRDSSNGPWPRQRPALALFLPVSREEQGQSTHPPYFSAYARITDRSSRFPRLSVGAGAAIDIGARPPLKAKRASHRVTANGRP